MQPSAGSAALIHTFNAAPAPADRGRWAPHSQPLTSEAGFVRCFASARIQFPFDSHPKVAAIAHCHHKRRTAGYRPMARTRFNIASTPSATTVAQRLGARQTEALAALQANGAAALGGSCRAGGKPTAPPLLAGRGRLGSARGRSRQGRRHTGG